MRLQKRFFAITMMTALSFNLMGFSTRIVTCSYIDESNPFSATATDAIDGVDDGTSADLQADSPTVEYIADEIDAVPSSVSIQEVESYHYEVVPLLQPFNQYFYIKTDNPNPTSFRFVDHSSKYKEAGDGSISCLSSTFADVLYENESTQRVHGGYLASGSYTDGGELVLQAYDTWTYRYVDTNVKVSIPNVIDVLDYLIQTYGNCSSDFFERMNSIESGLQSICLYNSAYVIGDVYRVEDTYWGVSNSPHIDQTFYIQNPYNRTSSKAMLVSRLYPYIYDSLGFPNAMASVAKRMEPSAQCAQSADVHYLVDVTYNGETRQYGGAGVGGGKGVESYMVQSWYKFDGSANDAANMITMEQLRNEICSYQNFDIYLLEDHDPEELTYDTIINQVGEGAYVNICIITSIFGFGGTGFSYFYNNGGRLGYFSDAWYDGRYFNRYEYYEAGAKFEDYSTSKIIIKDAIIKYPTDGKSYYFNYRPLTSYSNYDAETGVWKGYTAYYYNKSSGNWTADHIGSYYKEGGVNVYITDPEFIDAGTLTPEEVAAMNIDRNTYMEPGSAYIYNMDVAPGTYGKIGWQYDSNNQPLQYYDRTGKLVKSDSEKHVKYIMSTDRKMRAIDYNGNVVKGKTVTDGSTIYVLDENGIPIENGIPSYSSFASYQGAEFYEDLNGDIRCTNIETGQPVINEFRCDGTYTYFFQADGTAMRDRLTYHPDGKHIIYFDKDGHEVFSDYGHITTSIAGDTVDDYCFFDVYGYMYVDVLTYDKSGTRIYYVNPYGVLEHTGWFSFSDRGYGYANSDMSLMTDQYTYDWNGNLVYMEADGHIRGTGDGRNLWPASSL